MQFDQQQSTQSQSRQTDSAPLIEIRDLKVEFRLREGDLKAVDGISFDIYRGQTVGIIGESGSGKSVTAQAIMRLLPRSGHITQGEIRLHLKQSGAGQDVIDLTQLEATGPEIREIRWDEISMVFQEPMTSFSPVHTIADQITEAMLLHLQGINKKAARERAIDLLRRVGIPQAEKLIDSFPFQFSGGMRQRAMIAMALSCNPQLLIADEPTTALDVTIEAQILALMKELQAEYNMALMFITHDLAVIGEMADEVVVMYLGQVMEHASVEQLFTAPKHPYTRALWRSIPTVDGELETLTPIEGTLPSPYEIRVGCPFFSRCEMRIAGVCDQMDIPLVEVEPGHQVRCILYDEGSLA